MPIPTPKEPVKVAPSTSAQVINACPRVLPGPVTKLITPSGSPASRKDSANKRTTQGVSVAGFITTVFPATRAAPAGPPVSEAGKLNGLITSHTPYGRMTDTLVAVYPTNGSRPISTI